MNENEFENVVPATEEPVADEAPAIEEAVEETVETKEVIEDVTEVEETTEDVVDETVEEIAEEAEEVTEDLEEAAEEVFDETSEIVEDDEVTEEEIEEIVEEIIETKKKSKAPFVVIAIVIVVAILAGLAFSIFGGNKYNKLGYVNPDERTIAEVAEVLGVSLEEFLSTYSLPADMPADTEEMAAYFSMPVKIFADMYGIDFETFKTQFGIPDETTPTKPDTFYEKVMAIFGGNKTTVIDENTPWGLVLDEITLDSYVGEENLESFKEFYGLGDDVTAETKYKDVRKAVDAKTMELAAEAKAAQEAAKSAADNAVETTDEVTEDQPVADETTSDEVTQ